MAGAGVVPRIRAFLSRASQNFVELYFQARVKLLQEYCQRGAHDARTDKNYISMIRERNRGCHRFYPFGHPAAAATYGFTIFFGSTTLSNSASVTKPSFSAACFSVRSLSMA